MKLNRHHELCYAVEFHFAILSASRNYTAFSCISTTDTAVSNRRPSLSLSLSSRREAGVSAGQTVAISRYRKRDATT